MVKVAGPKNVPGGFITLPGATYVGDSKILRLAIFLEGSYSSRVLLKFANQGPVKIDYHEFVRVVDFLEDFRTGVSQQYDSSQPNSSNVSVVLLESGRVLFRWGKASIVIFPLEFLQALNVLLAIKKRMKSMIRRRAELKAAHANGSLLAMMRTWGFLAAFVALIVFDLLLLISLFAWPQFFVHWLVLTIALALCQLFFKPDWLNRVLPAIRDYLSEGLLLDLTNLTFPRKSFGLVVLLVLMILFYFYFGGRVVSFLYGIFEGVH